MEKGTLSHQNVATAGISLSPMQRGNEGRGLDSLNLRELGERAQLGYCCISELGGDDSWSLTQNSEEGHPICSASISEEVQ